MNPSISSESATLITPAGAAVAPKSVRRGLCFAGPGCLVAVGYMDPGNWATSIAGGSRFGYSLLAVILVSNLIAMLFQAAAVRLGIASGRDLAQACRDHFGPGASLVLWGMAEFAVVACNIAEVLGMAIGLKLLFGIPMLLGVFITAADVMLVLSLQRYGFRLIEAFVAALVALIAMCFVAQVAWLHPPAGAVLSGFVPHPDIVTDPRMLYVAVGIVGATVMPHNLYLHSAVVQNRPYQRNAGGKEEAIFYSTLDSSAALGLALFVNAGILIVAAAAFHRPDLPPVTALGDAYRLMSPVLGIGMASAVFGVALLASGLSASITGTLAGQIVMEGFLTIRLSPGLRSMLTRALAIVPAGLVTAFYGERGVDALLVFSQVILSLQLPFAAVPLVWFTTRKAHLGSFAFGTVMGATLWTALAVVTLLDIWLTWHLLAG